MEIQSRPSGLSRPHLVVGPVWAMFLSIFCLIFLVKLTFYLFLGVLCLSPFSPFLSSLFFIVAQSKTPRPSRAPAGAAAEPTECPSLSSPLRNNIPKKPFKTRFMEPFSPSKAPNPWSWSWMGAGTSRFPNLLPAPAFLLRVVMTRTSSKSLKQQQKKTPKTQQKPNKTPPFSLQRFPLKPSRSVSELMECSVI